jgi:hypothetical protein
MTRPEESFDFRAPDYNAIFRARIERLTWLRAGKPNERAARMTDLRAYYAENPADFINDWACTVDPRNAERKLPVLVPFVLMPKQRELITFVYDNWRNSQGVVVEKARDVGASWILMSLSATMCLFHRDFMAGVGSAKEDKVDRSGDPDTLFYKAEHFLTYIPPDFTYGWDRKKHRAHLRIVIPHMGSSITGEAGDNIGRGGRKSWYIVDEAAHVERPKLIDASLAATTNCRIDASSVNGMANSFAEKVFGGKVPRFTFTWRDDLRKDDAWYQKKCDELDPVIVAQELNLDYNAAVDHQIIPAAHVAAAIDAHVKLGIKPTGVRESALDWADVGRDKCAHGFRRGCLLEWAESWNAAGSDTLDSLRRVERNCDARSVHDVTYDADGMGAPLVSLFRVVNETRDAANKARHHKDRTTPTVPLLRPHAYRSSGAVMWPEQKVPGAGDRRNEDLFANFGAQAAWHLARMFRETHAAVNGKPYDPELIISISGDDAFKERGRLMVELSQPKWKYSPTGKLTVDKVPDGALSPNLGDMCRMLFAPRNRGLVIAAGTADRLGASG